MRVIRLAEFMAMPGGTLYAKGKPWFFGPIQIKHENTLPNDWYALDPCWIMEPEDTGDCFGQLDKMLETGESFPMQDAVTRDASYQENEQAVFLVFEKADLAILRDKLNFAIQVAPG